MPQDIITSHEWYQEFTRFVQLKGLRERSTNTYLSWIKQLAAHYPGKHLPDLQSSPVLSRLQWNHNSSSGLPDERPLIIGHRGAGLPSTQSALLIGNTRRAIKTAIDAKVDWIEIDIRITSDNKLVVFHDPEINEKTSHKGAVAKMSLDDLKSCNVLVDPPEKILSLEELLSQFQANERRWIFDIKTPGISSAVIAQITKAAIPSQQIIIFGDHEVLQEYQDKGFRLGYTTLYSQHQGMILSPSDVIQRCLDHSYDLLVVLIIFVTPHLISAAWKNQLEVWSYDSNDPRDLQYCAECGVRGLIVDTPKAVMGQFRD